MPAFCLIPKLANEFITKIKNGEIDPIKLAKLSSKERRDAFSKFMGEENAKQVNRLFESKLLLKNQQQGMITWAKQLSGLKKEAQRDMISKIEKMDRILSATEQKAFLEDLASHKLGANVTLEEAGQISKLSREVIDKRTKVKEDAPIQSPERMEYGRAQVDLLDFVDNLKFQSQKLTTKDFRTNPVASTGRAVSNLAGFIKSMKATLDNSVIGRQGWKVLFTNPKIWAKNSLKTFSDIVKTFGGKEVMREVRADVLSRPNAVNGQYRRENLAVGVKEEAFPTSWPQKIPGVGRVFKASESAFTAFQYRTRADIFDKYYDIAQRTGADHAGIGKLANSLTGRGSFGPKLESAMTTANKLFFSPRLLKSHFDTLTAHAGQSGMSPFARKLAAKNTLKIISGIAAILTVANATNEDAVEWDPRSSDFGKIRVGNTSYDVSGGMSSLVTLATRLIRNSSKSSSSGKITKYGAKDKKGKAKFGSPTRKDAVYNFLENKTSPALSMLLNMMEDQTFEGDDYTIKSALEDMIVPIPITNIDEIKNDDESSAARKILTLIADGLGISANTYER